MNINEQVHSFWASGTPAWLQIFSTKQLDLPMFKPPIACLYLQSTINIAWPIPHAQSLSDLWSCTCSKHVLPMTYNT